MNPTWQLCSKLRLVRGKNLKFCPGGMAEKSEASVISSAQFALLLTHNGGIKAAIAAQLMIKRS